jgi:hypothetical protein
MFNLIHSSAILLQYITAIGALYGAGSGTLLFFKILPFGLDGPASTPIGIASSSSSSSGALRFRLRFLMPFSFAAIALAACSARALLRSS